MRHNKRAINVKQPSKRTTELDEVDLKVAYELMSDANQGSREIAKKLGKPHTTINRRIKKLISNDIIHIVALPNPKALGYDVWVIIGIIAKPGFSKYIAKTLLNFPFCYVIAESLGPYNIIAAARFKSIDELTIFICNDLSRVEGIEKIEQHMMVRPIRFYDFRWMTNSESLDSSV